MLPNTFYVEKYTQMRQTEMLESARLERLILEAQGQKPKLWQKLTWRLGDWLIGLGHRLKYAQRLPSKP